jgi:hypothetical protein
MVLGFFVIVFSLSLFEGVIMCNVSISAADVIKSLTATPLVVESPAFWEVPAISSYYLRRWLSESESFEIRNLQWDGILCDSKFAAMLDTAGYKLTGKTIPVLEGAAKPSKILRKYLHEVRSFLRPHWCNRPHTEKQAYYQNAGFGNLTTLFDGSYESILNAKIKKVDAADCVLYFSSDWPESDDIFGDDDSCYYDGRMYSHCTDAIAKHGGVVCRALKRAALVMVESGEYSDSKVRENDWSIGRCWVMPTTRANEVVVCNSYHVSPYGWFGRDVVANAIKSRFVELGASEVVVSRCTKNNAPGWYVNNDVGYVVGPVSRSTFDLRSAKSVECYECGCDCDEEDTVTVGGENYCRDCLSDNFFNCEVCEECAHNDEYNTVCDFSDGCERCVCDHCVRTDSDIVSSPSWMGLDTAYIALDR